MARHTIRQLVKFLKAEDGPTAVEYAVMLAFIIVICVGAVQVVGQRTNGSFSNPTLVNNVGSAS